MKKSEVMKKSDLVDAIAAKVGLTKKDAEKALSTTLNQIELALQSGKEVSLIGFGSFKVRHYEARQGVNPRNGEPISISARTVPTFKPGKALKDALN